MTNQDSVNELPAEARAWVAEIADALIPEGEGMPSASKAGVSGRLLDNVLKARPSLARAVISGWTITEGLPPEEALSILRESDPAVYRDLLTTVTGAYYANPDVRQRLNYGGQVPGPIRVDILPEFVSEGLLDRVIARGPIFREPPPD